MRTVLFALFAISVAAGQAWAEPPSANQTDGAKDNDDKLVCKDAAAPTGSLLPPAGTPKICHTSAEWQEIQRNNEEQMHRATMTPGTPS